MTLLFQEVAWRVCGAYVEGEVKMNKETKLMAAGVLAAVGIVILTWSLRFWGDGILSSTTDDWAAFGSFFGGLLGPFFSLATILYLVWSFRKQASVMNDQMQSMQRQTELMQEQMALAQVQIQKDREKNERDLLVSEIRNHIEVIEKYCFQRIEIAPVIEEYFNLVGLSGKDWRMIDCYTFEMNGKCYRSSAIEMLNEIEYVSNVETVKKFIENNEGLVAIYPIKKIAQCFVNLIPMLLEARRKGADLVALTSMISRVDTFGWMLNRWGELDPSYLRIMAAIKMLPVSAGTPSIEFKKEYLKELKKEQQVTWLSNDVSFEPTIIKETVVAIRLRNLTTHECWEKLPVKKWKKVS